ncbi:MAG TPA: hypothetical protein VFU97_08090 [Xanthobacteraceae bacterium]|nr:hypothetical protein [Xanthobacteraceae bacterium]
MSTRIQILRSKEAGCRWAARLVTRNDTRALFERIADQYAGIADELEQLERLAPPWMQAAE